MVVKEGKSFTTTLDSSYCAVTVKFEVTLVKSISQPVKIYPALTGSAGAVADLPCSTVSVFNTVPSQSVNVTVYNSDGSI